MNNIDPLVNLFLISLHLKKFLTNTRLSPLAVGWSSSTYLETCEECLGYRMRTSDTLKHRLEHPRCTHDFVAEVLELGGILT